MACSAKEMSCSDKVSIFSCRVLFLGVCDIWEEENRGTISSEEKCQAKPALRFI